MDRTNITNLPQSQEKTIYSKVVPKGRYLLTAKLYMNNASGAFVSCSELRNQWSGNIIYTTLSGYVYSDGVNPININAYQTGYASLDRTYDYDFVRLVRIA